MSQYYYNPSAQDTYHDENDLFEFDLSRPLKDYPYPPRQTTFDLQPNTINSLPTYHEAEVWCVVCETSAHLTDDCPIIPAFKEVLYGQSSNTHTHKYEGMYYQNHEENYYSDFDAYHPDSHFHPNFSWKNDSTPSQPHSYQSNQGSSNAYQPPHRRSLEDTLQQFMQGQMDTNERVAKNQEQINTQIAKNQEQTNRVMEDLRNQLTKLTTLVLEEVVDHSELDVNEAWEEEERKIEEKDKDVIDNTQLEPKPLAPQSLTITLKDPQNADKYEVFGKVEFILPLLDTINQTLSIVKLLKNLSVVQRNIHEFEKVCLTKQVSVILPSRAFLKVGVG